MLLSPGEIKELADSIRRGLGTERAQWDMLSAIYRGQHHELFPKEFRRGEQPKIAGFLRRSWDGFAHLTAKVPDIRATPIKLTQKEQERADTIEKICFTFNDDSQWNMRRTMKKIAHHYVGMQAVGVGLTPDFNTKTIRLLVEDPRNVLPGPRWDATTSGEVTAGITHTLPDLGGILEYCIIQKTLTGHQIRKIATQTGNLSALAFLSKAKEKNPDFLTTRYPVLAYFDDRDVTVVLDGFDVMIVHAPHGAPWCPWQFWSNYASDSPAGSSSYFQQIGLEIAYMRFLDQKLALNDRVVWGWLKLKGFADVDHARRTIKLLTPDSDATYLTPPTEFQVDRDMSTVRELLRLLSHETEASQGDVTGGPITGRGIVELTRSTIDVVQSFFDDYSFYLPNVYRCSLLMLRNLFPDEKMLLSGWGRGETFLDEFVPRKSIGEKFGSVRVEFGPGLGGYEGFVGMLQAVGAEAMDVDTVMEHNPHIRSVTDEKRKLLARKVETFIFEQALSGGSAVPIPWLAELAQTIRSGGDWQAWLVENPPGQETATPGNVGPLPPEIAAGLGGGMGGGMGDGLGGLEAGGDRVFPPSDLMGLLAGAQG